MSHTDQTPQPPAGPTPLADRPEQTVFERELRELTEGGQGPTAEEPTRAAPDAGKPGGSRMPVIVVALVVAAAVLWVLFR